MAGKDQQRNRREQFRFAEPIPFLFDGDQLADQVISGMLAFVSHQVRGVFSEGAHGSRDPRIAPGHAQIARHRLRPDADLVPVGVRHPQHLRNDIDGQGKGIIGDEIHLTLILHPVEQLVGNLLHARA